MIILGGFASISVGALFMGGFVPGFLISLSYVLYILIRCYLNPELAPVMTIEERPTLHEKIVASQGVALPVILVLVVLGGIWTGVTTAIEGAGVGAFGALICALIKHKLNFKSLNESVISTLKAKVMVMWLLIGGSCYAAFMSASGMSTYLGDLLMNLPIPPMGIVGVLMFVLVAMGMFIDSVAIIMITVPIFFPIIRVLNLDPIWFGVLFTIAIIIGYITPPFGYNLFYMRAIIPADVSTRVIYRAVMPYVPITLLILIICMLFPKVVLFLPQFLMG
jgi:tripartite ATP-independent transporter DctM subunit